MAEAALLITGPDAPIGTLTEALRREGLTVRGPDEADAAAVLIVLGLPAEAAIRAAETYMAGADGPGLVVLGISAAGAMDWPGCRDHAVLTAFTRHTALFRAPRGIRINLLELAGSVGAADLARAASAMWRWRSMTGQTVRLAAAW